MTWQRARGLRGGEKGEMEMPGAFRKESNSRAEEEKSKQIILRQRRKKKDGCVSYQITPRPVVTFQKRVIEVNTIEQFLSTKCSFTHARREPPPPPPRKKNLYCCFCGEVGANSVCLLQNLAAHPVVPSSSLLFISAPRPSLPTVSPLRHFSAPPHPHHREPFIALPALPNTAAPPFAL